MNLNCKTPHKEGLSPGTNVQPHLDYAAPILVVDDHPMMVDLMTRSVRRIGFKDVDCTTDGIKALNILRAKRYKVVISDLHMEPFGGLELLRSVRSDETLRNTRLLMATGDLKADSVAAAKKLGANSYLLQPFSREQLQTNLTEILKGVVSLPDNTG